MKLGNV